ncbi:hypothetical protein BGZ61DRAFT_466091 [Ilyonectria robusta]|uniref:uncharacterized protein n=1 Tax=Ilyonectria robusta TaxID=1079257 RepID=UPI001E8EAE8D|nr:uncharacterized protein BGZ61DRAFT_470174 [Ilyonectria robusta]XP_046095218.1 uncharacterized protein BGZ61DRAFT_466091 [Ilyonectria robusta]KAH8645383.1 hypothetical protein BGZ61DRAFT_470174 [Ilyonectria robusta]KAH8657294.1 hypothetical protein BGZ61DRAFT_466091 [Ilyonectria robusta]
MAIALVPVQCTLCVMLILRSRQTVDKDGNRKTRSATASILRYSVWALYTLHASLHIAHEVNKDVASQATLVNWADARGWSKLSDRSAIVPQYEFPRIKCPISGSC